MYQERARRCDTGCGRMAFLLLPILDLAFCEKHTEVYEQGREYDVLAIEFEVSVAQ